MDKYARPKVSVCMATYNGELYLSEQIISILDQLNEYDELIIFDDCSKDGTVKIVEAFSDKRIRLFVNKYNKGVITNFSQAIQCSRGDYIFLSDQDDIWLPNKIETTLSYFMKSNANLVVSDAYIMKNNQIDLDTFYKFRNSKPGIINNIIKNSFIGCCIAFDRKIKDAIGEVPKGFSMHDLWIGILGSYVGEALFIPDRLIIYRRHESNVTQMNRSSLIEMTRKRLKDVFLLSNKIVVMNRNK